MRRRPWAAALLSFFIPGLGQLYAGQARRGALLLLLFAPITAAAVAVGAAVPAGVFSILLPQILILALRALVAGDAVRVARGIGPAAPLPDSSRWYACVTAAALVLVVVNPLWGRVSRNSLIAAFKVPTGSMAPMIVRGDHLLVAKWTHGWRDPVFGRVLLRHKRPARGDLVVFPLPDEPTREFLKRVIGLPGETIEIHDGAVFVDGQPLREPYLPTNTGRESPSSLGGLRSARTLSLLREWGPETLPDDAYFMLGDNRDNSRDSRFWGFVDEETIAGRATVVFWSWDAARQRVRWERIGNRLN